MLGALEIPLGFGVGHGFLLAHHHGPEAQGLMLGECVKFARPREKAFPETSISGLTSARSLRLSKTRAT